MKKLKLNLHQFTNAETLTCEQLKTIMGGSGETCSCTLKSSTSVSLTVPISSGDSGTLDDCKSACKTYCDGANSAGGDCANYNWTWTSGS